MNPCMVRFAVHGPASFRVISNVIRFPAWVLLTVPALLAADLPLADVVKSVETHYNRAQSLTLTFSETYSGGRRPVQNESGTLYLRKPGRMRWDYKSPVGKIFLSDGKNVFDYTPGDDRATKSKLTVTDDLRAPLAFLLGKLEFAKEFSRLRGRPGGSGLWIEADAKTDNLAYTKVEFLALPSGEIRRVIITGQDLSRLEFAFSAEKLNVPVAAELFIFRAPAGVEVREETGR